MPGNKASIFPISIKHYSIGFTLMLLLMFSGLVGFSLNKVLHLNNEMDRKNAALATQEFEQAIEQSIIAAGRIANKFALWEETIQQYHNSVYYSFWRANRAVQASFLQDYFIALELYDKAGLPLSGTANFDLFTKIKHESIGASLVRHDNKLHLYYTSPVVLDERAKDIYGYVVVNVDFKKLLNSVQKFKQLDYASLQFDIPEDAAVAISGISQYARFGTVPNVEYSALESLLKETLQQLAILSVLSVVGFLFIIIAMISKPLEILSQHIDSLGAGKHDFLKSNSAGFHLVIEFDKLRVSLNDYIHQLQKLEKVAGGDADAVINADIDKEAGGLMQAFNSIVSQLRLTMQEKDHVSQQLREQADELRLASEQALSATRSKSAFLANMSHEIRTPLTAIIGFAEELLEGDHSVAERQEGLSTIVQSGRHLLQIINDILDLSKVEANKLSIEKVSISPFQIVSDVESLVKLQAAAKHIEFAVHYIYPLPGTINTDPIRLKQIILNLCNNAVKFTHSGYVYLNVSSDLMDHGLSFEVADSGIGLTEDQMGKIFTPFTQADVSTTRKFGGTGLGLSLSKTLAEMLGGDISVKSKLGVGSKFTLTIPVHDIEASAYVHHESLLPAKTKSNSGLDNRPLLSGRVLVTDDVSENQKLIKIYLNKIGIDVDVAQNGREALDMIQRQAFDLVLMDVHMPVMDGLAATEQLRRDGNTLPVIALTANAYQDGKDYCLTHGFTDYIMKPIDRKLLYTTMARYLPKQSEVCVLTGDAIVSSLEDSDSVADIIDKFVDTLPTSIARMKVALGERNWRDTEVVLHTLKGTAANMGFMDVANWVTSVEFAVKQQQAQALLIKLNELEQLAGRIKKGKIVKDISTRKAI